MSEAIEGDNNPGPGIALRGSYGWVSWLLDEDVARVLTWDALVDVLRHALTALTRGTDHPQGAVQPLRVRVPSPGAINSVTPGAMMLMPGMVRGDGDATEGALATKILCVSPGLHHAHIMLFHPITCALQAVVEGDAITQLRTAAASAVATLALRPPAEEEEVTIAVLGAGRQAKAHAQVLHHFYNTREVRVWARRRPAAVSLVEELQNGGIRAVVSYSVKDAVQEADIINICTGGAQQVLQGAWVKPGAHVNSIGALHPDSQEMDEALVRKAIIYADNREQVLATAGDIIKTGATICGEVGELLLELKSPPRSSTTIFKSMGLGIEDAVCARLAYDLLMKEADRS